MVGGGYVQISLINGIALFGNMSILMLFRIISYFTIQLYNQINFVFLESQSLTSTSSLGFWNPHRNIFNLVDGLDIKPFTNWMKSAQYSGEGLEVIYINLLFNTNYIARLGKGLYYCHCSLSFR